MANFKKHLTTGTIIGGLAGFFINLYQQIEKIKSGEQEEINFLQLLGNTAGGATLGAVGGVLPDMLEPSTSPRHRKLFHSLTVGTTIGYGLYKTHTSDLPKEVKTAITATGVGYLSHLALDSSIPNSLPLL